MTHAKMSLLKEGDRVIAFGQPGYVAHTNTDTGAVHIVHARKFHKFHVGAWQVFVPTNEEWAHY